MQAAASIIRQAALGLDYAHQQGLIHRDVKPGNILVTPTGIAKVSDVGLAGFAQDLLDDPRAGKIMGTADYLSPEQIRTPLEVDPRSDIYALGCTLYYAVCGKVPFPGGDTASKIRRHLQETPWHPRRFAPELSEDFVDIIADMMDKDPAQRVSSAAEVAARIEPWTGEPSDYSGHRLSRSPWQAPPPPDSENSSDPALVLQAAEDSQMRSATEASEQVSGIGSQAIRSGQALSELEKPPVPVDMTVSTSLASTGTSVAVIVALTLAIALPPALLIGAIIGFLIKQNWVP